mmetsp:Transcript_31092/g.65980  ORF Transcript_31092/g.65980 Transcript_31092/m.65980 type:complete len:339 (+) Transcript_31092:78-1094(+)
MASSSGPFLQPQGDMREANLMEANAVYAEALKARLRKARLEVESQANRALKLKSSIDRAQDEAEQNGKELADLKAKWAQEQPQREAFLKRTGEKERRLGEKEDRCAEVLASHAAAADAALETSKKLGIAEPSSPSGATPLKEHRSSLVKLEQRRSDLTSELQDLRDQCRQVGARLTQKLQRSEAIRRELKGLKVAIEASERSKEAISGKITAVDDTLITAQKRNKVLEEHLEEEKCKVQSLKAALEVAAAAAAAAAVETNPASSPGGGGRGVGATCDSSHQEPDDATVWTNNLRLQEKVTKLQEQLFKKRAMLQQLRQSKLGYSLMGESSGNPFRDLT